VNVEFSAKNLDLTEALKNRAHYKLGKIARVAGEIQSAHITFELDGHQHRVEMTVHVDHLGHYKARAESEDMYVSLREAADNIERQAKKDRDRRKDRHRHGPKPGEVLSALSVEEDDEEEGEPHRGREDGLLPAPGRWLRRRPMALEDAVLELEAERLPALAFARSDGAGWGVLIRHGEDIRYLILR